MDARERLCINALVIAIASNSAVPIAASGSASAMLPGSQAAKPGGFASLFATHFANSPTAGAADDQQENGEAVASAREAASTQISAPASPKIKGFGKSTTAQAPGNLQLTGPVVPVTTASVPVTDSLAGPVASAVSSSSGVFANGSGGRDVGAQSASAQLLPPVKMQNGSAPVAAAETSSQAAAESGIPQIVPQGARQGAQQFAAVDSKALPTSEIPPAISNVEPNSLPTPFTGVSPRGTSSSPASSGSSPITQSIGSQGQLLAPESSASDTGFEELAANDAGQAVDPDLQTAGGGIIFARPGSAPVQVAVPGQNNSPRATLNPSPADQASDEPDVSQAVSSAGAFLSPAVGAALASVFAVAASSASAGATTNIQEGTVTPYAPSRSGAAANKTGPVPPAKPEDVLNLLVPQPQTNLQTALHNELSPAPASAAATGLLSNSGKSGIETSANLGGSSHAQTVSFATGENGSGPAGMNAVPQSTAPSTNSPSKSSTNTSANSDIEQAGRKDQSTINVALPATQPDSASTAPSTAAAPTTPAATVTHDAPLPVAVVAGADPAPTQASQAANPKPNASAADASGAPAQFPATNPPGPVQLAQMVNRATQSEMRIGLSTSAFGSVEVRTVVRASDVGLSVGSEKGDLHALLANEIPALTNSLQQQSLRLSQVSFQQGTALGGNTSSGSQSQQRAFASNTQAIKPPLENEVSDFQEAMESDSYVRASGLSILA